MRFISIRQRMLASFVTSRAGQSIIASPTFCLLRSQLTLQYFVWINSKFISARDRKITQVHARSDLPDDELHLLLIIHLIGKFKRDHLGHFAAQSNTSSQVLKSYVLDIILTSWIIICVILPFLMIFHFFYVNQFYNII